MDYKFMLTPAGLQLQARVQAGAQLVFTRAAVTPDADITDTDMLLPLQIASVQVTGPRQATLTLVVSNNGLINGTLVGTLGVWANDPAVGEILYGIVRFEDHPGWIPPYAETPVELVYDIIIGISEAAQILIEDNGSLIYVTHYELEDRIANHRHPADQIDESTGETTEEAQRRQDAALEAIGQAAGTNLIERWFAPAYKLAEWEISEGILDGHRLTTGGAG